MANTESNGVIECQKKLKEVKRLGFMDNGTGQHQSNTVYSIYGCCPNITTIIGGGTQQIKIMDKVKSYGSIYGEDKGKEIDVASTVLAGYERSNMTGFNADNGVMEKVKIKQATEKGYVECDVGGVADLSYPTSKTRRGRVQEHGQVSPALTVSGMDGINRIESEYRIRKLTPLECWRLMGFTDEEFHKAEEVNSNTQLYKQAGNSIVVDVLEAIFRELMEVLDMESKTYKIEDIQTDMMIDLVKFRENEPKLFEELCKDYPVENKKILITVV